ncbi:MAG: hypothetical protein JWO06_1663 [Bacteroidota bacterium]|nr:hypothetical protein [Bacteroidota bacterium]
MDPVIILLIVASILLVYQLVFKQSEDKLDEFGHPVKKRRRTLF